MATPKSASMPGRDGAGGASATGGASAIADVVARADYEIFAQALADDVVFRSPVSRFRFRGSDITSTLFERLVKQSDPDRWKVQGAWNLGEGRHLVDLTTTVRGHQLDLLIMTRMDENFRIREVMAYGRPMAAIGIFPAFVYPHLAATFRSKRRGTLLRVLFRPFPRLLDRFIHAGLHFGQPPQAEFETELTTPEESPSAEQSPAEPAGPRSPFRRV